MGEGRELVAFHPNIVLVSASLALPMHPMNVKTLQLMLIKREFNNRKEKRKRFVSLLFYCAIF